MARKNAPLTDLELVTEALTARAGQYRVAASTLAARVAVADRAGEDVRTPALVVTRQLARAEDLERISDQLAAGQLALAAVPAPAPTPQSDKELVLEALRGVGTVPAAVAATDDNDPALTVHDLIPDHETDPDDDDDVLDADQI